MLRLALKEGAASDAPERLARAVTDRLGALGVHHPAVTTEVTDSIERSPAGKLRLVVPDRAAGGTTDPVAGSSAAQ